MTQPAALPALSLPEVHGSGYPEPFKSRMGDRVKRRLGEAFGLTQFGVNLVVLGPGGQSALRHWHLLEDEFMYLLEGELVLVTNAGEQVIRAGDCAGYKAGEPDGHHLINRSDQPARYLEIGSRREGEVAFYPDDDLALAWRTESGKAALKPAHKDGQPY
jgi:uncharacterized cupin superfamily protein